MLRIDGFDLKYMRQALGYKKAPLCVHVGCSLTSLTNWEGGINPPGDEKIEKIVEFIKGCGYDGDCIITK